MVMIMVVAVGMVVGVGMRMRRIVVDRGRGMGVIMVPNRVGGFRVVMMRDGWLRCMTIGIAATHSAGRLRLRRAVGIGMSL
jgi:hypothetical protein